MKETIFILLLNKIYTKNNTYKSKLLELKLGHLFVIDISNN